MTTVRQVLKLPSLCRGVPEVVAGHEQLDRAVRWVHVGEIRQISNYLAGGELLLTTGMGVTHTAADQRALVAEFAERGLAGVIVELGPVFSQLPGALVAESERRGLPLVALHSPTPFVEITEEVHREIISRQFSIMRHGERLGRKLSDLMLAGGDVPALLESLATSIMAPVVLEGPTGEILARATFHLPESEVLGAWESYRRGLPGHVERIERPVGAGPATEQGRLVALGVGAPLTDFDAAVVERAAVLIGLAMLRHRYEETLVIRERGDFLYALLDGDIDDLRAAAHAFGLGFESRSFVPVALRRANRPGASEHPAEEGLVWQAVWRDLNAELRARRTEALLSSRDAAEALLVLAVDRSQPRAQAADRLAECVGAIVQRRLGRRDAVIVCVGAEVSTWAGLARGLRGAWSALPAAAHAPARAWHDVSVPDLSRLLWSLRGDEGLRTFVQARLGPALDHDRAHGTSYVTTLAALSECGWRKTDAARHLHIERQSLYARLARIEECLCVSLGQSETMLGIHLALRALPYLSGLDLEDRLDLHRAPERQRGDAQR